METKLQQFTIDLIDSWNSHDLDKKRFLDKVPDLKFGFIDIAESIDSVALVQRSSYGNKITVSNFFLNEEGKIRKEIYFV